MARPMPPMPPLAADLAAQTAPLLVPPPWLPPFLEVHGATQNTLRRAAAQGPTGPGISPQTPLQTPPQAPSQTPPPISALSPEDDLAARIDRLLAEEARRHGIDV